MLGLPDRNLLFGRCAVHSLNDVGFDAHAVSRLTPKLSRGHDAAKAAQGRRLERLVGSQGRHANGFNRSSADAMNGITRLAVSQDMPNAIRPARSQ